MAAVFSPQDPVSVGESVAQGVALASDASLHYSKAQGTDWGYLQPPGAAPKPLYLLALHPERDAGPLGTRCLYPDLFWGTNRQGPSSFLALGRGGSGGSEGGGAHLDSWPGAHIPSW